MSRNHSGNNAALRSMLAIVGDHDPKLAARILEAANFDVELAVNRYMDSESRKALAAAPSRASSSSPSSSSSASASSASSSPAFSSPFAAAQQFSKVSAPAKRRPEPPAPQAPAPAPPRPAVSPPKPRPPPHSQPAPPPRPPPPVSPAHPISPLVQPLASNTSSLRSDSRSWGRKLLGVFRCPGTLSSRVSSGMVQIGLPVCFPRVPVTAAPNKPGKGGRNNTKNTHARRILRFCRLDGLGGEFGSCSTGISRALVPLLDRGLIEMDGVLTDLPAILEVFSTVELEIRIFLTPLFFVQGGAKHDPVEELLEAAAMRFNNASAVVQLDQRSADSPVHCLLQFFALQGVLPEEVGGVVEDELVQEPKELQEPKESHEPHESQGSPELQASQDQRTAQSAHEPQQPQGVPESPHRGRIVVTAEATAEQADAGTGDNNSGNRDDPLLAQDTPTLAPLDPGPTSPPRLESPDESSVASPGHPDDAQMDVDLSQDIPPLEPPPKPPHTPSFSSRPSELAESVYRKNSNNNGGGAFEGLEFDLANLSPSALRDVLVPLDSVPSVSSAAASNPSVSSSSYSAGSTRPAAVSSPPHPTSQRAPFLFPTAFGGGNSRRATTTPAHGQPRSQPPPQQRSLLQRMLSSVADASSAGSANGPSSPSAARGDGIDGSDEHAADDDESGSAASLRMSDVQLNALYGGQVEHHSLPQLEINRPDIFLSQLHGYQKQALRWMVDRETQAAASVPRQHPLWDKYSFADGTPYWVNPFSLRATLQFPEAVRSCRGGILADEMGMGKTIETLALIVHNHPVFGAAPPATRPGQPAYYASDDEGSDHSDEDGVREREGAGDHDVNEGDEKMQIEASPSSPPSPPSSPEVVRRRRPWSARKAPSAGRGRKKTAASRTPAPTPAPAAAVPLRKSRRLQERQADSGASSRRRYIDPSSSDEDDDDGDDDGGQEDISGSAKAQSSDSDVDCEHNGRPPRRARARVQAKEVEDPPPMVSEPPFARSHSFPAKITPDLQPAPPVCSASSEAAPGSTNWAVPGGASGSAPRKTTLVVCPTSLLDQWMQEVALHCPRLRAFLYYGDERSKAPSFAAFDIVITSYGTLSAEANRNPLTTATEASRKLITSSSKSPLLSFRWFRTVLDEAHCIKNRLTDTAKACFRIQADRRWCLTGTPVQNRIDDVYSLVRFLREDPWANLGWWSKMISKPFEEKDPRALSRLQAVLRPLVLRRVKSMKINGKPILELPEAVQHRHELDFSEAERDFYAALYKRSQTEVRGFVDKGLVLTKYSIILTLLLRLRQTCDHPFLVAGRQERSDKQYAKEIAGFMKRFTSSQHSTPSPTYLNSVAESLTSGEADCRICLDVLEQPVMSECGHVFCRVCVEPLFNSRGLAKCPICRQVMSQQALKVVPSAAPLIEIDFEKEWKHSAKTAYLFFWLAQLREWERCRRELVRQRLASSVAQDAATGVAMEDDVSEAEDEDGENEGHEEDEEHAGAEGDRPGHGGGAMSATEDSGDSQGETTSLTPPSAPPAPAEAEESSAAATMPDAQAGEPESSPVRQPAFDPFPAEEYMDVDAPIRCVVFSQWTLMLDLIEVALKRDGYQYARLDGSLSQTQRTAVLRQFSSDRHTTILLVSLRAGGVGLNLVSANHVFFLDCWWNPAVEEQAVQRVHRIGQKRRVHIHRFIIRDSVEGRILALQERKSNLAASVSMSSEEAKQMHAEDIRTLFAV